MPPTPPVDAPDWAWPALVAARERARRLDAGESAAIAALDAGDARVELIWRDGRWHVTGAEAPALFELYLPCCAASAARPLTVGHLGQSLDGYVATASGDSDFVTGRANIVHLHRMRALCDAIIVGAGTVAADDPRLTTRLVDGKHPTRVVLDPKRRLAESHAVFTDAAAPTLLVVGDSTLGSERHGQADVLPIGYSDERLDLAALIDALHARGLHSLFVEGGGATVSRFVEAGLLDRLQIAIAPMLTGRGRAGLRLPARERIAECLTPAHHVYAMGADLLFDCDLRSDAPDRNGELTLTRIG